MYTTDWIFALTLLAKEEIDEARDDFEDEPEEEDEAKEDTEDEEADEFDDPPPVIFFRKGVISLA